MKPNFENTYLGIELGSTRIKAVLIDESFSVIASGSHAWENRFENGYWTYPLEAAHEGIRDCFRSLQADVTERFGAPLTRIGAIGISGMMHGYLAFDENWNLLSPFRTWRNTTAEQAAEALTELFHFHIPQRWSIAHLYQAMLSGEAHTKKIAYITTLAGYIHYRLTGRHEVGMGEASGIFPLCDGEYDPLMLDKFQSLSDKMGYTWDIRKLLPSVRCAGDSGAFLTDAGAKFLDPTGTLCADIPLCPPEGDAGTGMVATNAVLPATGNASAGTSVFAMLVLDRPLRDIYRNKIDIANTPDGAPVAMIHCNNGCSELDAWVGMFDEFARLMGMNTDIGTLYERLYQNALNAPADCGGLVSYNFLAGEPLADVEHGAPMFFRTSKSKMTLGEFFRSQLYATLAALKLGLDLLVEKEAVRIERFSAHGGLFKVKGVAQQMLADAFNTPITVQKSAGEGGAWGMALLAAYMQLGGGKTLPSWLDLSVFANAEGSVCAPSEDGVAGFARYTKRYVAGLDAVRALKGED